MSEGFPKAPEIEDDNMRGILARLGKENRQKTAELKRGALAFFANDMALSQTFEDRLLAFLEEIHKGEKGGTVAEGTYAVVRKELIPIIDRSTKIVLDNRRDLEAVRSRERAAKKERVRASWKKKQ